MQKIIAMHIFSMQMTAAFLFITGAFIGIWVDRRRFYRRSGAGRECYDSYSSAELNGCLNSSLNLLAKILIILGIILAVRWRINH